MRLLNSTTTADVEALALRLYPAPLSPHPAIKSPRPAFISNVFYFEEVTLGGGGGKKMDWHVCVQI